MIRAKIRHVFTNFNKKQTINDYLQDPVIVIKQVNATEAKYVARPMFNSIKVGERKEASVSHSYRKYKVRRRKSKKKTEMLLQVGENVWVSM